MYSHLFFISWDNISTTIESLSNTPTLIAISYFLHILIIFATIFVEKKNASSSWAWLLVLVLLPYLGIILYLLLGRSIYRDKIYPYSKDKKFEFQKKYLKESLPTLSIIQIS